MKREIKKLVTIVGISGVLFTSLIVHNVKLGKAEVEKTDAENYVDMNTVTGFESDGNSLYLHFDDGTGYYWESENSRTVEVTDTYLYTSCVVVNHSTCEYGTDVLVEMPDGDLYVYHSNDAVGEDIKQVCFRVPRETAYDYTQYEIVSFE